MPSLPPELRPAALHGGLAARHAGLQEQNSGPLSHLVCVLVKDNDAVQTPLQMDPQRSYAPLAAAILGRRPPLPPLAVDDAECAPCRRLLQTDRTNVKESLAAQRRTGRRAGGR